MKQFYRIAYRVKPEGSVVKTSSCQDLMTSEKLVKALNERYGDEYEYFFEYVSLPSLSEGQLFKLASEGHLSLEELARYTNQETFKRYLEHGFYSATYSY
jgi:hypothetical protein